MDFVLPIWVTPVVNFIENTRKMWADYETRVYYETFWYVLRPSSIFPA